MQRTANPRMPVRFRPRPPGALRRTTPLHGGNALSKHRAFAAVVPPPRRISFRSSSAVEQATVNRPVAGSNPCLRSHLGLFSKREQPLFACGVSLEMPPSDEKVELVERTVSFQGYFRVGTYLLRHSLFKGGQSQVISREVFETGRRQCPALRPGARRGGADPAIPCWRLRRGPPSLDLGAGGRKARNRRDDRGDGPARGRRGGRPRDRRGDPHPQHAAHVRVRFRSPVPSYLGRVDTRKAGGVFGLEAEGEDILVRPMPFTEVRHWSTATGSTMR